MHNKKARVCIIWNALWCALIGITALCMYIPIVLAELQVANKDLVVDICSENARPEKVDTVQVGDVHTPTRRKPVYMYEQATTICTYMYMYTHGMYMYYLGPRE